MLSALTTSLLPESVASLFEPPLDSRQLHLSLLTGRLQLTDLRLHADRCSALLLPPPAAPLRVQSGRLSELELGVDWKNLFSQPLKLVVKGLHLRLQPAPVPAGLAAHKGAATHGPSVVSPKVGAATTPEVEWKEEDLLRMAVERKLLALEAAAPLLEGEEARAAAAAAGYGPDSASGGSSSTSSSWLKKLITLVLNSLHAEISDVSIEIEGEGQQAQAGEWASTATEQTSLLPVATPSSTAQIRAGHDAPVKMGVELMQCVMKQAMQIDRPVAAYNYDSTKLLQVAAAVYCDVAEMAEKEWPSPAPAQPGLQETDELEAEYKGRNTSEPAYRGERKEAEAASTTSNKQGPELQRATADHDFLVEPFGCDLHMAFNSDIASKLELQARLLLPLLNVTAHPAQVVAVSGLLASILRHQATVQCEVDRISDAQFRPATDEERERYMSLMDRAMRGQKLNAHREGIRQQLERVLTLKNLAVMRHAVRARLHEKQLLEEHEQLEAEERKQQLYGDVSQSSPQVAEHEQTQQSMWKSVSSFFSDLVSGGEEERKTPETKAAAGGSMHASGVGKLQSALEEATPFDLDVQIECVAESICAVLFENNRKSEEAALLALSLHDGALCVDTDPGGAVNLRAGVRQLSFMDATRPQDPLPSTYLRTATAVESSIVKPEKPKAGSPFELLPKEFYRAMPFYLSGRLLPTVEAVSRESEMRSKSPGLAVAQAKTADHLNELELAVSGVQAQLLLTLATKLARVSAVLQACIAPLSSLPPAPLPPTDPDIQPKGMSAADVLAAMLPMRFRLNVGGGVVLPFLGEAPAPAPLREEASKERVEPIRARSPQARALSPLAEEAEGPEAAAAAGPMGGSAAVPSSLVRPPQVSVAVQTSPQPAAPVAHAGAEDQGMCTTCLTWCTIQ